MRYQLGLMLLLSALTATAHAGDIYRWVDAQGVTHYSDRATASRAEAIQLKTGPADSRVPDAQAASEQPAATLQSTAQIRADECTKAQARLDSYRQADQLLFTDSDGEQREATPDERIQAIVRAETQTRAFCAQ